MKKSQIRVVVLMLLVPFFVAVSGFLRAVDIAEKGLGSSEAASWAQAWGTIFALIGAIVIAFWQHKAAEQTRENERRQAHEVTIQAILALAMEFQYLTGLDERAFADPKDRRTELFNARSASYADIESALQRIPLHELPLPTYVPLVTLFLRIVRAMKYLTAESDAGKDENLGRVGYEKERACQIVDELTKALENIGAKQFPTSPYASDYVAA